MRNDAELIELVTGNHMLATRALVRRAEVSRDQWLRLIEQDVWIGIVPGIWRHAATPLTWEMSVRAGALWLGRSAALHGRTALAWLGIDACATDAAEFIVPRARRHVEPWLALHTTSTWTRGDTITHRGVRTCTATRAIIDMARTERPRTIEAAIDEAISRRLTSVPTLTSRMRQMAGSGRSGIRLLRTLLLDSGGESILERRFLRLMRVRGLPRPRSQVIYRAGGTKAIRVDFAFPGSEVIVEVSGRRGHTSDRDRQRDARRRNELQGQGNVVVEFTTADVLDDPDYVEAQVRHHLRTRPRHALIEPSSIRA